MAMMGYNEAGWSGGDWLVISVMMFVFLGVLVALAVWVVGRMTGSGRRADRGSATTRADGLLAERYARGEMSNSQDLWIGDSCDLLLISLPPVSLSRTSRRRGRGRRGGVRSPHAIWLGRTR
jgi:putative membrane protein